MSYPQEFIVTLRDLKEDHRRLFDEHKVLTGMLRDILDNQAVITDNQAVLREEIDALERKLDEVVALIRQIRAL